MATIALYLSRLFLARLLLFLLGFGGLLLVFDLLETTNDVLDRGDGGAGAMLHYVALRLPSILSQLTPLSVLLAALTTLLTLAQHSEIVALKSAGMSFFRLLGAFLPVTVLVAAGHFLISDQVLPRTDRALQVWWETTKPDPAPSDPKRMWLRSGDAVISIARVAQDGASLDGVALFRHDRQGLLVERISARRADYLDGGWVLTDVRRFSTGSDRTEEIPSLLWETRLAPRDLAELAFHRANYSLRQLRDYIAGTRIGAETLAFYETRLHKKFAGPVAVLLMILIAAPVAQGERRHGAKGLQLALGVAVGFCYFVVDGLVTLLGEAGTLPPLLAAWAPTLLFAGVGGSVLLAIER